MLYCISKPPHFPQFRIPNNTLPTVNALLHLKNHPILVYLLFIIWCRQLVKTLPEILTVSNKHYILSSAFGHVLNIARSWSIYNRFTMDLSTIDFEISVAQVIVEQHLFHTKNNRSAFRVRIQKHKQLSCNC